MSQSEQYLFDREYCQRVKLFRKETGLTSAQMAEILRIPAERYRKYESRSPLPPYLVATFCMVIGCDLEHLLLGKPRDRNAQMLVARKVAAPDPDILRRVAALSEKHQKLATAMSETSAAQEDKNHKKSTPGT
jgi:transcriptional regulator with XRE-family HTH domain